MKLYDTTLRDGSQGQEVNFTVKDKIEIVKLLDDFGVDYVELGWPYSNPKDRESFDYFKDHPLKSAKIVAFGSTREIGISADDDKNLKVIVDSGAPTATIYGKTWIDHVEKQLKTTPEKNLESILDSVQFLKKRGLEVFYDAEHFFDGFKDNQSYALQCLETALDAGADCLVLCDTNGGCLPGEILKIVTDVNNHFSKKNKNYSLGIHCHNDTGCGVANSLIAVDYLDQIQGTINGLGERTGNADLCSIIPNLILKKGLSLEKIQLSKLKEVSDKVDRLANIKSDDKRPYVGKLAFVHKAGRHVDAISKGATYEHTVPRLVGNRSGIVLSDLSGPANIVEVVKEFGYPVDKKDSRVRQMLQEIKEMEKQGYNIGDLHAEKFLLTQKYFGTIEPIFEIKTWKVMSEKRGGNYSECVLTGLVDKKNREVVATIEEGGPVDANFHALQKMIASNYKEIKMVKLTNFKVMIAEDKGVKSTVRVYTEFQNHQEEWGTVGISSNILEASKEAIEKGFTYFLLKSITK